MAKVIELRKKTEEELAKMLSELEDSVRSLRFKISSKEIKNHQLLRMAKKDIARILTIMKERKK